MVPPTSVVGDMGTRRFGLAGTMDMGTGALGLSTPVSTPAGHPAAGGIGTDAGSGVGGIGRGGSSLPFSDGVCRRS